MSRPLGSHHESKQHTAVARVLGFNDSMTHAGAQLIRAAIIAYWKKRGYDVRVVVTTQTYRTANGSFTVPNVVRSDMRNGYPASLAARAPQA